MGEPTVADEHLVDVDAMTGLDLAKKLGNEESRAALEDELAAEQEKLEAAAQRKAAKPAEAKQVTFVAPTVRRDNVIPRPPDLKSHIIADHDLDPPRSLLTYLRQERADRLADLKRRWKKLEL